MEQPSRPPAPAPRLETPPRPETQPRLQDLGGWPAVLGKLAARDDLSPVEAGAALGEILEGAASPSQMAAFIFGLRCKGETVDELAGMLGAMLAVAEIVPVAPELAGRLVDTCGTGGDRAGTINVSTIAALVVAGAGVPVCKHGGRAASSRTGSADVLEALGVEIALAPAAVARCIEEAGIGFCFAPRYHPAMRHVGPTRRELGVPTAINLLGPLANPARAPYQLVGVGDGRVAGTLAGVLASAGASRAWVVHGGDGLDELSTGASSRVVEWRCDTGADGVGGDGRGWEGKDRAASLHEFFVDPGELGLRPAGVEALAGGDPARNAAAAAAVLEGEAGPHRDITVLNAGAALVVAGAAAGLAEGVEQARASIDSGAATRCLEVLTKLSREESARERGR